MAAGDAAAAAGLDVVAQTEFVRDGATELNKTRDYIAEVMKRSAVGPTAPASPRVGDLWFEPI